MRAHLEAGSHPALNRVRGGESDWLVVGDGGWWMVVCGWWLWLVVGVGLVVVASGALGCTGAALVSRHVSRWRVGERGRREPASLVSGIPVESATHATQRDPCQHPVGKCR